MAVYIQAVTVDHQLLFMKRIAGDDVYNKSDRVRKQFFGQAFRKLLFGLGNRMFRAILTEIPLL